MLVAMAVHGRHYTIPIHLVAEGALEQYSAGHEGIVWTKGHSGRGGVAFGGDRGGVAFAPDRERWEGRWGAASSLAGVPDRPASAAHYISATADVTSAFLLWTPAFYCGREVRLPCAPPSPATCAPLRLYGCVCTRLRAYTAACLICAPWGVSMCCRSLLSRIIMPCTSPPSLPL